MLSSPLSTARAFTRDDEIELWAEVHASEAATAAGITTTMTAEDGRVVFQARNEFGPELRRGAPAHEVSARIPLQDVTPGPYLLRVEARLGDRRVAREVVVRVVADR